MTFYVAAKVKRDELRVRQLIEALTELGHTCTYDWSQNVLQRPFRADNEQQVTAGRSMLLAAAHADLLVVLLGEDLVGVYIELGAALYGNLNSHPKHIVLVGSENQLHESVFYFQPNVHRCHTVEKAIELASKLTA